MKKFLYLEIDIDRIVGLRKSFFRKMGLTLFIWILRII